MYEGKKLEIHVVDHCNLDCVGCSHESPFLPTRYENPDELRESLRMLWEHYYAPCIVLIGGEPLLHPNIDSIIRAVQSVTDVHLRLRTNGTLLADKTSVLPELDDVLVSVYPDADLPSDEKIRSIAVETETPIIMESIDHFRWARTEQRNDPELTNQIFDTCKIYHYWQCHTLKSGNFYPCPPTATWAANNREGVDLFSDHDNLEAEIDHILNRKKPFESCHECLGSTGKRFEHKLGWRESEERPSSDPVDYDFLKRVDQDLGTDMGCYQSRVKYLPTGEVVEIDNN